MHLVKKSIFASSVIRKSARSELLSCADGLVSLRPDNEPNNEKSILSYEHDKFSLYRLQTTTGHQRWWKTSALSGC